MKSGTNWIGNLLNLHPDICCLGEFHWQRVLNGLNQNRTNIARYQDTSFDDFVVERFERFVREAMNRAAGDSHAKWIGDRTPAPIEPKILRHAPIVYILRDARDVLVSRAYHLLNRPKITNHFESDPVMAENLRLFKDDESVFIREPERLLRSESFVRTSTQRWAKVVEDDLTAMEMISQQNLLNVRYEQLHEDTESWRSRLYEFLDLDPAQADRLTQRASPGFANESPNALYRKGIVGDWQNYVDSEIADWIKEEAGETLIRLGYEQSNDW